MFQKLSLVEYDIRSANANVLYAENIINKDLYNKLINLPKKERNIFVGNMMKDDKISHEELMKKYEYYVERFIKENNLENNIYEVVKDAVWIFGKYPTRTQFNNYVVFTKDRVATSILELNNIKFYYDSINGILFNRGLGDIDRDTFTFLDRIKNFIMLRESNQDETLYVQLHKYHINYINNNVVESDRYNITRKSMEINNEDPMDDKNYIFIKLMIEYLIKEVN